MKAEHMRSTAKTSRPSIGANGAGKQATGKPTWVRPLNACRSKIQLRFESDTELDKAIDLLWNDDLYDLPHDTPDGHSIVIPAEALEYFVRAKLKFSAKNLRSIDDLDATEIENLRKQQLTPMRPGPCHGNAKDCTR